MFDAVYFQNPFLVVENAGETILADAQFLERAARERFG
jgi:hypothetical protein